MTLWQGRRAVVLAVVLVLATAIPALAAGVPQSDLEAEQADWLDVREDAARYSRNAVAQIYRQRIQELAMMSEN